jgi:hypothetical protein
MWDGSGEPPYMRTRIVVPAPGTGVGLRAPRASTEEILGNDFLDRAETFGVSLSRKPLLVKEPQRSSPTVVAFPKT